MRNACTQCKAETVRLLRGEFMIQVGATSGAVIYVFKWLCVMCFLKQVGLTNEQGRFKRKEAEK